MSPEFWAIIGVGIVLAWFCGEITRNLHIAAVERREDHREMMVELERIASDVGNIEMSAGSMEHKLNPPDLSDYD